MDKKIKIAIIVTFSLLFLFLLTGTAKATCYYFCSQKATCDCGSQGFFGFFEPITQSSCIIGDQIDYDCGTGTTAGGVPNCTNAANTRYCQGDACPNISSLNGQPCKVRKDCWGWDGCSVQECSGKWDANKKMCVACSGKVETKRFGSSSGIDVQCGNCNGFNIPDKCESACDPSVSTECDDVATDSIGYAVTGGTCNNCIFTANPPNCPNGAIDPGEQCDLGPPLQDAACPGLCKTNCQCAIAPPPAGNCEETIPCSCVCPDDCPCSGGKCEGGLVPCGRTCDDPCTKVCECCHCTLCHLFVLLKKIVDFFTLYILFPVGALMFVIGGGFLLISAGDPNRISSGKKILTSAIIGILIVFLAWVIVNTVIVFATTGHIPAPGEIGKIFTSPWSTIDCEVTEETSICPDRGTACAVDSECCLDECGPVSKACYNSSLSLGVGDQCYDGSECLSGGCIGIGPGVPGNCQ